MEMKDKLYCHHKSKFSLVMKRFSLTCLGVISVLSAIAVPTYISTLKNDKVVTEASELESNKKSESKNPDNEKEDSLDSEEKILEYE